MISVTFPFCRSRIFSTHEGRDVVRRFFAILQAGNSGAGFSIPHQATRISCPLDTHGDKLSPLGVFQPFPCNSIGGRPRGAWSFVVRCKKKTPFSCFVCDWHLPLELLRLPWIAGLSAFFPVPVGYFLGCLLFCFPCSNVELDPESSTCRYRFTAYFHVYVLIFFRVKALFMRAAQI